MSIKIEAVTPKVEVGEGPFWDSDSQSLYFADVIGKYINKYTPSTKSYAKGLVPNDEGYLCSITAIEGQTGEFLVGVENKVIKIGWDGKSDKADVLETITELKHPEGGTIQLNDAKVDIAGRLWIGSFVRNLTTQLSIKEEAGGLYCINPDRSLKQHLTGVTLANGLDWNKNRDKFYFIDSLTDKVLQFDFNAKTSEISNKQVIFKFGPNGVGGIPDGMAIDTDDNLWIASFGGGKIVNIDPRKPNTIIRVVDMPVKEVTSVAFGGPNLDELYVTTAGVAPMENYAPLEGGYLYRITGLGVRGNPGRKIKF